MTTGIGTALRRPGLTFLLWTWYTVLGLVVTAPAWSALRQATGIAPETDLLLDRVQLGTVFELLQASGDGFPALAALLAGLVGLALLSNAFLNGGMIDVLLAPAGGQALLRRFFHGAGRFFLRSLGLLAITVVLLIAVAGVAAALVGAALSALLSGAGEAGTAAQALVVLTLVGAIAAFFLLALDYSRILLVREDAQAVVGTWLRGASFVVRRPIAALTPGLVYGPAIAATLALAAWVGTVGNAQAWSVILLALLGQQALLVVRVMLRVALVSTETLTVEPAPEYVVPQP